MSEDDAGPDPNAIRRHQKKMLTEEQYRKKYRRIDFYRPNSKQLEFHNCTEREVMLRAGNQVGKTHAAGAHMTIAACAIKPGWYEGHPFPIPKTERPHDFIGWAGCTSQQKTRDGIQLKLLGDYKDQGGLGTGLIPLDNIIRVSTSRGVADLVDTITLRRETGGTAIIREKTFEQGREGWQGEPCDLVWIDEDPSKIDPTIYGECLARLTTTDGRIIVSMTPMLGPSALRRRFREKTRGTREVLMGIMDCLVSAGGHIPDERLPELIAQYPENERETRLNGADMQGEGAVFVTPVVQIKHRLDPAAIQPYWRWIWGLDFRHSGSETTGHPFAAVLLCHNTDADEIYVMHAVRMLGLAPVHVAAIKRHAMWDAPVAWPHDGGRGASLVSGETISQTYKKLGLYMRPTHATFKDGGYSFEAGLFEMENRFSQKRLLVAEHLTEVFDEYLGYHRVDGLVVKQDDDLLSAIRVALMDIRYAKPISGFARALAQQRGGPGGSRFARGTAGHPDGDIDPFTGR